MDAAAPPLITPQIEREAHAACADWRAEHETLMTPDVLAEWADACEEIARRWAGYCAVGGRGYAADMTARALPRLLGIDEIDGPSPDCETGEHWPADALHPDTGAFDSATIRAAALDALSGAQAAIERASREKDRMISECRRVGLPAREVGERLRVTASRVRQLPAWMAAAPADGDGETAEAA